jgi:hypothetical protein
MSDRVWYMALSLIAGPLLLLLGWHMLARAM